jgi:hypothetical protein
MGGTRWFSYGKRAIFSKVKEIKYLSGGIVLYATQTNTQIDTEIAEKGRFRKKTNYLSLLVAMSIPITLMRLLENFHLVIHLTQVMIQCAS